MPPVPPHAAGRGGLPVQAHGPPRSPAERSPTPTRGIAVLGLLAGLALCATPVDARGGGRLRARLVAKVEVRQTTQAPTFTPASWPNLVDRGRRLYVGRGLFGEHENLFLLEATRGRRERLQAPVEAYLRAHRRRFPVRPGLGRVAPYEVQHLLYYDRALGVAGLLVAESGWRDGARTFHFHWDLRAGRISRVDLLGTKGPDVQYVNVKPIGFDPTRQTGYVQVMERVRGPGAGSFRLGGRAPGVRRAARYRRPNFGAPRFRVRVLALGRGAPVTVATLVTERPLSRGPFHDPAHGRALLVEYAERSSGGPAPRGYLVDLRGGTVRRLTIPLTNYGAAFTPDGRSLALYGSQLGELWQVDLTSLRVVRRRKVGTLGHGLGFPSPAHLLLLRHKHLHVLDPASLRERHALPVSAYHRGFSHVEGSVVAPGRLWMRNTPFLYLIALTP